MIGDISCSTGRGVRAALRAHTAAAHQRLHDCAPFRRLSSRQLTLLEYVDMLQAFHQFHRSMRFHVELATDELGRTGVCVPMLARIETLETDLASLRSAPSSTSASAPEAKGPAFSIGCYYVVEGSALGGRVLHRQLDYLLHERAEGRSFFTVADRDRWLRVCAALERYAADGEQLGDMVIGARTAFECFEHHLREHCNVD